MCDLFHISSGSRIAEPNFDARTNNTARSRAGYAGRLPYEDTLTVTMPGQECPHLRAQRRRLLVARDIASRELGKRRYSEELHWGELWQAMVDALGLEPRTR
jgi:hypothetical protein